MVSFTTSIFHLERQQSIALAYLQLSRLVSLPVSDAILQEAFLHIFVKHWLLKFLCDIKMPVTGIHPLGFRILARPCRDRAELQSSPRPHREFLYSPTIRLTARGSSKPLQTFSRWQNRLESQKFRAGKSWKKVTEPWKTQRRADTGGR